MENILAVYPWSVTATLAAIFVYFIFGMWVGNARYKYKVKAPATTGNLEFEKRFRVQMNTLEGIVIVIPLIWLCVFMGYTDFFVGACGLVWSLGRIIYAISYVFAPESRISGFLFIFLSQNVLMGAALITTFKQFLIPLAMGKQQYRGQLLAQNEKIFCLWMTLCNSWTK